MQEYGEIGTLQKMNSDLEKTNKRADAARIHNPSGEVREALADFVTTRLKRVERDASFSDEVRDVILQRLPEATFEELTRLLDQTSRANNQQAATIANLFKNENSDKTVLERVADTSVASTAAQLYASTEDKSILQAVTYLGSVLSKMSTSKSSVQDAEVEVVE